MATILALLCTESPRRTVVYAGQTYHVATGPRALPQGACTSPALSNLVVAAARRSPGGHRAQARLDVHALRRRPDVLGRRRGGRRRSATCWPASATSPRTKASPSTRRRPACSAPTRRRSSRAWSSTAAPACRASWCAACGRSCTAHAAKGLAAQNRDGQPHFEAWLRGMIAYIHMVNPDQAAKLQRDYDSLV